MLPDKVRRAWIFLVPVLVLTFIRPIHSQTFDFQDNQVPLATLDGPWRFHTGDDPRWAQPAFDDLGWKLLRPEQPWAEAAEADPNGFAWYRFKVRVPSNLSEPSLYVPKFASAFAVFADGKQICAWGSPPPRVQLITIRDHVCRLGNESTGRSVTIAIRSWYWIKGLGGGPGARFRIGSSQSVDAWARANVLEQFWNRSAQGHLVIVYLIGTGGLVLFLLRRKEREYLWFGVYELFSAIFACGLLWSSFHVLSLAGWEVLIAVTFSVIDLAWVFFLASFLKVSGQWPLRIAQASIAWNLVVSPAVYLVPLWSSKPIPPAWLGIDNLLLVLGNLAYDFGILYPLYKAARARVPDAVYLLIAFVLFRIAIVIDFAVVGCSYLGWHWPYAHLGWFYNATNWPFPMRVWDVTELLTQIAMLGILGLRFVRSRRDEERMTAELEAAKAVQQVLIPAEAPNVPGLAIETAYKPAGEVGGDFFQIIPLDSGGALIVIGDVSGKGMPAAMTVSLLVGTFRTLAHYSHKPSEILNAMNQRMLARSKDGFTTCLVLRVDPDGTLTIANAGHLSPYMGGKELNTENGLPLGLAADCKYAESTCSLPVDSQLTLVTDGVVEARNHAGELFGFQRAAAIMGKPAESIAQAAQEFGQEDDITVLTITRLTVIHEKTIKLAAPELSPSLA